MLVASRNLKKKKTCGGENLNQTLESINNVLIITEESESYIQTIFTLNNNQIKVNKREILKSPLVSHLFPNLGFLKKIKNKICKHIT